MKFTGILNETGPTLNENAFHSFVVAKQIFLWQLTQLHRCNWHLLLAIGVVRLCFAGILCLSAPFVSKIPQLYKVERLQFFDGKLRGPRHDVVSYHLYSMKFTGILNETGPTLNENAFHSFVVAKQIFLWQLPQLHRCNWQLPVLWPHHQGR